MKKRYSVGDSFNGQRVALVERAGAVVIEMERTIDEYLRFRDYGTDYRMGDTIVQCIETCTCDGLSHNRRISDSDDIEPVYKWSSVYTVERAYRVGRNGTLRDAPCTDTLEYAING